MCNKQFCGKSLKSVDGFKDHEGNLIKLVGIDIISNATLIEIHPR